MNFPSSTPDTDSRRPLCYFFLSTLHLTAVVVYSRTACLCQPSPAQSPDSCPCCCCYCCCCSRCRPSHTPSPSPSPSYSTFSPVSPSLLRTPYSRQLLSPGIHPRRTCEKPQQRSSPLASPPALNLTPPPPRLTHPFTSPTAPSTPSCLPQLPVLRHHLRRLSPSPYSSACIRRSTCQRSFSLLLGGTRPTPPPQQPRVAGAPASYRRPSKTWSRRTSPAPIRGPDQNASSGRPMTP